MHEAKTRLSELVAAAESGEEVVIARGGSPTVRLVPLVAEHAPVQLGGLAGEIEIGEDFDDPLPGFDPYTARAGSSSAPYGALGGSAHPSA